MDDMDTQRDLRGLAAAAQRDGGNAAEALMGRVRQLALRYARARLGRFGAEDVAQDVAQEVCVAVHTGLHTYDDRGVPFEAFVYSIAAHKTADAQRLLIRGPQAVTEVPDTIDGTAGRSTRETAAALHMTAGAIRVAQHRALTKLRTLLAESEGVAS